MSNRSKIHPRRGRIRHQTPLRNDGTPKEFYFPKPRPHAKRNGPTFASLKTKVDGNTVVTPDVCSGLCSRCGVYGLVGSVTADPEKRTCKDGCKVSDLARNERRAQRIKDRKKTAKALPPVTLAVRDDTLPPQIITTGERVRNERAEHRFHQRADHVRDALAAAK